MCDHNHQHGDDCCHHNDGLDETNSIAYSLYQKIDIDNVECLNEKVDGSGAKVFKPWNERLTLPDDYVESDCDSELIFNIPFTGDVKLKGIVVIGNEEMYKMKLFKSNKRLSFNDVNCESDQEFEMMYDTQGLIEYPVKPTKFSNVHHLTIHFVNSDINDDTRPCRVSYIGFKGEFTRVNRDGIVIANYELRPTEGVSKELCKNTQEIQ